MAEPVVSPRQLPSGNGAQTTPPPPPYGSRRGRTYRSRFGISYILLALVLAAAGVGTYYVTKGKEKKATTVQGAPFNPSQGGEIAAIQIARFVQGRYRGDDGKSIVGVVAERPQVARRPIQEIIIEPADVQEARNISKPDTPSTPFYTKDILPLLMQNGMMYQLCGFGQNCSIKTGEPSNERARFLRVEALELALRTFKNDADIRNVVVFLPPLPPPKLDLTNLQRQLSNPPNALSALLTLSVQVQQILLQQLQLQQGQTQLAMFFRRDDLGREIQRPLSNTVPLKKARNRVGDLAGYNISDLDDFMRPFLFQSDIQTDGAGNPLLILQPVQQQ